ncbi:sigma-54-dependent Fis family transcriptional regulator [Rhodoferax sp.]|uniref:sigma-54-dependent Fis family transcriptional regulator n=1 Tax=Rhodoferax sp. TaxID=50421 RepID=UPI00284D2F1B|nr:sigma-54-dependent Fis family transcriptional regulator [Rhodoferax sp.]MDR3370657.1 sigma-54-dependent Fis family transcriptional regulator [Rhodoferax sp.]
MRTPPTAVALRQARLHLLEHGDCPPGGLDERVARSWRRSLAAGLLPAGRLLDCEHATGAELTRTLASNHDLLAHSQPVMEHLFEQVRHTQGMVILADKRGTLLHTLGHADFLNRADRVALSCGANWHEQQRGTNAIGTALVEAHGVEIHGAEHFLERNEFLTCTAVPILSALGDLMGVLDISGDQRSRHPHTLGLVGMASRMIENRLVIKSCQRHIRLHLHAQPEGIGSVAEGIVALSEDGWLVGANRAGMAMLNLARADLGAVQLANRLDVSLAELLSRHKRRPGQPTQVRQRDGTCLFVQVQHDAPALASPASVPKQPTPAPDALRSLDTGDQRWRNAADKVRRVLDKPIPLLIQGESGVGKELFARASHDSGPRKNKAFIAINCAAVPENLIEAELFGYAPGAFTGARREGSVGRLREAQGGTLFLDEIGDMPLGLQARLLRVLQDRQVTPLGGGQPVAVDFALICASHHKLREEAAAGRFRQDLYYRINGLTVLLPALRERTDFPVLTERLLADLNPGRQVAVAPEVMALLCQHTWPGNLRQYANVLRTASAMLDAHEDCITWSHLPDDLLEDLQQPETRTEKPLADNLQELSRQAVRQAVDASAGNLSQAARRLGISRQTLYRKLRV